jgi:hypothetical protein
MKMNRTFRQWRRKQVWAGLLVLLAVACGEFWLVLSFSRDCARSLAQEEPSAEFAVPEYFLVSH